jgi:hypothetical protein
MMAGRFMLKRTELRDATLDWIRALPKRRKFTYADAFEHLKHNFPQECAQRSELQQGRPALERDAAFAIWDVRLKHRLIRLTGVRGERQRV